MACEQYQPFRLLDLPGEIRNKIYKYVLCSFDPAPPSQEPGRGMVRIHRGEVQEPTGICQATHSIETNILRTCKQIHREAYDIMVKTNQFICIETVDIPMDKLLVPSQLPTVNMDREVTRQFYGYVLNIGMSALPGGWVDDAIDSDQDWGFEIDDFGLETHAPPAGFGPRFNFMILGRDWEAFCSLLADADTYIEGFSVNVDIMLTLNPNVYYTIPNYKASIDDFFTSKTQETLLKPFRTQLRGFQHVSIEGTVSEGLAGAIEAEVRKSQWTDPTAILRAVIEAKELGNAFYMNRKPTEASEKWTAASSDVRRMRCSSAWATLREHGGPDFLNRLAEVYFTILLNSAQCSLKIMQVTPRNRTTVMTMGDIVSSNLHEAIDVPHEFMHDGATWMPSDAQLAKLYYRQALCWRLMAEPEALDDALHWIQQALVHAPGDPVIEREKVAILEWETRVDEEMRDHPLYQHWMATGGLGM